MTETEQTKEPEVVAQAVENHGKTPQESFAELRKAKDDLERQLWQARQEKEFYEKQLNQRSNPQSQPQQQEEEYDFRQLEQEEFPDGKKLAKAFSTVNRKLSTYEQKLAEKDAKILMLETATEFPDFRDVVTAENIEKYIKSDEDNREAVEKASNPLRKCYNLIKKSAAYQNDKQAKVKPPSQEQQRVDEKEQKPKVTGIGVRSEAVTAAAKLSNSSMSREMRNQLWKETLEASRK